MEQLGLSGCLIKDENVKEEPDDYAQQELCNFTARVGSSPLKAEVKEEDEEEELQPPVRVFLHPAEVCESDQQEHEVKEEPDDNSEECSWNTDEELESPAAVFLKTETVCEIEDEFKDEDAFQENHASENEEEEILMPRVPVVLEPCVKEEDDNDSKSNDISLLPSSESGFLTSIRKKLGALLPGEGTYESPTLELSPDYMCNCGERPGSEEAATIHAKSHPGAKPFRCLICKKHFSTKGIAVLHMKIHFGDKPNRYISKRNSRQKNDLLSDKGIPSGENPMECYVCNKNFTEIRDLIAHVRTHTGGRPYECDVCEKIFWQKYNFFEHKRIHTGEKPFQCDICNKNFARRGNLIVHMRIHTGEKPFQCRICKKRFTRCSGLKSHQLTHNRKNPSVSVCKEKIENRTDTVRQ